MPARSGIYDLRPDNFNNRPVYFNDQKNRYLLYQESKWLITSEYNYEREKV